MNILFACFHPVDPQIVKNLAQELIIKNHKVLFTIVEKENIIQNIVKSYNLPTVIIGKAKKSLIGKLLNLIWIDLRLFFVAIKFKPTIIFSPTSPYTGHVSKILNIKHICWGDTETALVNLNHSLPFIDSLLLPDCFYHQVKSEKVIRFKAYKEIAYLHPKWFNADETVLKTLSLSLQNKIVLMRFSALNAMHDIGLKSEALSNEDKILAFIKHIEQKYQAKVFISVTERNLDDRFNKYKLNIAPEKYIHLLAFCSLYIGEGTTTASEAGVLGVPWIALRNKPLGYLIDQEENYGLGIRTDNLDFAFQKAEEYLANKNIKDEWQIKRKKLLNDKIDATSFFAWFIENYPKSHKTMIENSDYQNRFLYKI